MKKLLGAFMLLFSLGVFAQQPDRSVTVDAVKTRHVSTTTRNTYVVPAGETWRIYNTTTGQYEVNVAGGGWVSDTGIELPIAQSDVTDLVSDLAGKQSTLVSGTNIKTVGGNSILGSGNLSVFTANTVLSGNTSPTGFSDTDGALISISPSIKTAVLQGGSASSVNRTQVIAKADGVDIVFDGDSGVPTYTFNETGPSAATDVTPKSYVDTAAGAATPADNSVTTAKILNATIDEADLDASVNASLDLADSSTQPANTQTLTNKNIDGDSNTILNIPATEVNITDSGALITGTTAEEAFAEIATNIDNIGDGIDDLAIDVALLESRADAVDVALATPTTSAVNFEVKTTNSNSVTADAQDGTTILLDTSAGDVEYTIVAGQHAEGHTIRIQKIGGNQGRVLPGAGVDFGIWDGFKLDSVAQSFALSRYTADTSPEDWLPSNIGNHNYFVDPNLGNLFTTAFYGNLGSPSSSSAPTGLQNISGTIANETTTVFSGTTAMQYDCGSCSTTNFGYFEIPTTGLATSDVIRATFKYYIQTPGTQIRVRLYDATTTFTSLVLTGSTGVWLDGSIDHTLGSTTSMRFYLAGDGAFVIDDIKLIELP